MTIDLTRCRQDDFLGGRVKIWQPQSGYRAGMDAVLMAASCPAKSSQKILDVGCGAGTVALCLAARVPDLELWGIERQPDMAELARQNGQTAGLTVVTGDITTPPSEVSGQTFDHVLLNPPYFRRDRSPSAPDAGREAAMGEDTPLADLISASARRLHPKGTLTMVHRADRVPDILSAAAASKLGGVTLLPLSPRVGRAARLILWSATKGSRAPFTLLPTVILHQGAEHGVDGDDFSPALSEVLRKAAEMPGFDRA